MDENAQTISYKTKELSIAEKERLKLQDKRTVPKIKADKLEKQAQRHWDIFYKHNEDKFFKDRHWVTREFKELLALNSKKNVTLLELGCGVGNTFYPLLEEGLNNLFIYACDFSPRALELVKNNKLYNEEKIKTFQADITTGDIFQHVPEESINVISMIFVLSAIHPTKFVNVLQNALKLLKPGGLLLFRDYGRYDMAQIRFKPGHKIDENFYMRQDGTRSFYFSLEDFQDLCKATGFETFSIMYVQKRTINIKENVDVPRIFLQGKFHKPL